MSNKVKSPKSPRKLNRTPSNGSSSTNTTTNNSNTVNNNSSLITTTNVLSPTNSIDFNSDDINFTTSVNISDLPNDIINIIIKHLDLKSFLSIRCISKSFYIVSENEWKRFYFSKWNVSHRIILEDNLITNNYRYSNNNLYNNLTILDYNNPWKDLFIERFRIIKCQLNETPNRKGMKLNKIFSSNSSKESEAENYVEKGYFFIYRGEYRKAIENFEKAITLKKGYARAFEGLAKICWQRDLPNIVIVYAEEALHCNPANSGELYFLRGKALLKLKRVKEALLDMNKAIEYLTLSPILFLSLKISEVYYERMLCHIELGNISKAYKDCEKIVTCDRFFEGDCFLKAAKILFEKKNLENAEKFMKSNFVKKNEEYYLLLMQIYSSNCKYDKALECYRSFEELIKNKLTNKITLNRDLLIDIGIIFLMNNLIEEAIHFYAKAAIINRTNTNSDIIISEEDFLRTSLCFQHENLYGSKQLNHIEQATEKAKKIVLQVIKRQLYEYSNYFDKNISDVIDIQMAWSFYYFLLAMFYFYRNNLIENNYFTNYSRLSTRSIHLFEDIKNLDNNRILSIIKSHQNINNYKHYSLDILNTKYLNEQIENDLKHVINHLSRCITLNPTLTEAFYYRALCQCFLQLDKPIEILSIPLFINSSKEGIENYLFERFNNKKINILTEGKEKHKTMHKNISDKITIINMMREALNDINNSYQLINISFEMMSSFNQEEIDNELKELLFNIILLRAFIHFCFGKRGECLQDISLILSQSENIESLQMIDCDYIKLKCYCLLILLNEPLSLITNITTNNEKEEEKEEKEEEKKKRDIHYLLMDRILEFDENPIVDFQELDLLSILLHEHLFRLEKKLQEN
ncbi:hypothetical protein ABK040_014344 [Willaertia magna]